MKRNMLIYAALAAGVAMIYFFKRRKTSTAMAQPQPSQHSRHLTQVFSKAKQSNLA